MFKRLISIFLSGSALMVLVFIWVIFAPSKIGGNSNYLMIAGNSMAPGFDAGDLVIVQARPEYQINDIVAYKDSFLNKEIIHRVIDIHQDHYILQGDNNSWVDAYQPVKKEIIGKLWLHIPGLGAWFSWFRNPMVLSFTVGTLLVVLAVMVLKKPVLTKRRASLQ